MPLLNQSPLSISVYQLPIYQEWSKTKLFLNTEQSAFLPKFEQIYAFIIFIETCTLYSNTSQFIDWYKTFNK